jgi:S1-C subfamily serine protease
VTGAAEAEGIVLTSDGLVATSLARILGDGRQPAEFGYSIDGWPATVVATDQTSDIALLRAPDLEPAGVVRPGSPVRVGETVTLLDIQGGGLPTLGIAVTVTGTGEVCARAASPSRPTGFRFALDVATAEPGAAVVRPDGTVVGLYYGGDEASRHCAVPIADVLEAARTSGALD